MLVLLAPLVHSTARAEPWWELSHPCGFEAEGVVAAIRPVLTTIRTRVYEPRLRRRPDLSGRLRIELVFDDGLTLREARVTENRTGDASFGEEVAATLRSISWPTQRLFCGPVRVSFPFVFAPAE